MDHTVIDNFLPSSELELLKQMIVFNPHFPLYYNDYVSYIEEPSADWRWYANHVVYNNDAPNSEYFKTIYDIFIPKFSEIFGFKSLMRIKVNMYPHTDNFRENEKHVDMHFLHNAAVFSLNTCDGFTRLFDGTKVESVENRLVKFEGSQPHNSTTTTNKARYNINFNWL